MIDVKNLTKWYGRVLAVDSISFHVERGSIVGFLGPNGAGKSTTLKIITCYLPATSGKATIGNHDIFTDSMEVRRLMGYMPESVPLYPEMKVVEYLNFRAKLRDIPSSRRKAEVDRVAERCWLSKPENMLGRRLGELSRGYKQRVGLADVMLHNPPVLVLDEPTIGLDPAQIRSMRELICSLAGEHTVILSSHILAEVEQTCTHLIVIAGGKIAATGTPGELRDRVTGPSRIIAEVRGEEEQPTIQAVKTLRGVKDIQATQQGNWHRLLISSEQDADIRSEVFRLAGQKGWQLRELKREIGSLEDFFVQITYEQNLQAGQWKTAAKA